MAFNFNNHTHRRFNPLLNSWVMVAPHRTQRPWNGAQEQVAGDKLPEYDPQCFLCPGNKRAKGDVNPHYKSTFIFENDYAAVKPDQPDLPFTSINEEEIKNGGKCILCMAKDPRQKLFVNAERRCNWHCACYLFQSCS